MIRRVFSSLRSFKPLELHPGLNILIADKSPGASDQQTRNRAGKSSLVELVHFLCGGNCDSDSTFRAPELVSSSFGLEMDVFGEIVRVSRSASEPSKLHVESANTARWPKQPKPEKDTDRSIITNSAWRCVLGSAFFDLDEEADSDEANGTTGRPTFRTLFSYFARREAIGGMRESTRHNSNQQTGDSQIAISYLIGFDWTIAQQWESIRQKEKQIKELKRIVGQGFLADILDSAASLRSRLVVAEERLRRITTTLSTFRVHEQYHDLEREASAINRQLNQLSDENSVDRDYLEELEAAMAAETPPVPDDLSRLYEEAGVVLPDSVRRRYDDVLKFHESVIRNRRSYLQAEHAATSARLAERDRTRDALDRRRSELMSMLKSHGALDQFVSLQAEHGRLQAETETLRRRFEAATQLESTSSSLEADRVRLMDRLRQEFDERGEVINDAIRTFSNIVEELYGEPGQLEFHPTHNGPDVRIAIQGDRSRGIGNMEIFCFDMMLQRMCARQSIGPGYLIHDSHLFDGVDPRQTWRALAVGARLADDMGFQYLVTLNSDLLADLPSGFDIEKHLVKQRLTDASLNGGLFGLRFEPPRGPNPEATGTRPTSQKRNRSGGRRG